MTETVIMMCSLLKKRSTQNSCKATGVLLGKSLVWKQMFAIDLAYCVPYVTLAAYHDTA